MNNNQVKFNNLEGKIEEVLDNNAEFWYLEFVFKMFNSDISKEDYESCFLSFTDSCLDLYNSFRKNHQESTTDDRDARFYALYHSTKNVGY